jgi:glycosyltransferase involved in cell wall biosynthesis
VRILLDYRPALRQRTGVGEYVHRLAGALVATLPQGDALTLFSSSWKDRLPADAVAGAGGVDARIPVTLLNLAWHRLEWPPAEWFSGPVDVTHSMHPLMVPSRTAARFVTIHDLYFLDRPEHTSAEIRRDYPALTADHARRADGIVVPSEYTRGLVQERLGIQVDRITVCSPGAPAWSLREEPHTPGPILFIGALEPRKNVPGLLRAYEMLLEQEPEAPPLVLAGRGTEDVRKLVPVGRSRADARVRGLGYVSNEARLELYRSASMLVMPSFDEGFGLPALEAMTVGVPVIVARRGALPEVVGTAGLVVDPDDHQEIADAMAMVLSDRPAGRRLAKAGVVRSRTYSWYTAAHQLHDAYAAALSRRRGGA